MKLSSESERLFKRAVSMIPGGVNSPVRAFTAVGGDPRFIARGAGPHLWDVDGNRYVDLVASWGPLILGHAHPDVVAAVRTAAGSGLSFGAPTPVELDLVEEIRRRVPPVEQVRLVNSGTEAAMSAVRLARGVTGRTRVVKFAGHYHGHTDSLLVQAGSGNATLGTPSSAGVSAAQTAQTIVVPYNDPAAVRAAFAEYGDEIACVITEAAAGNMGVVPPAPGFTATLRRLCDEHGALLISDEVMTGFRLSPGGWWGIEGVVADLFVFGKVMAGGMPAAAFGGRAEVMAELAPVGPVYQAGTLSGNPVAVSAGLATLRAAQDYVYAALDENAARLCGLLGAALTRHGVAHRIPTAGSMFSVFFGADPVPDFAAAQASQTWRYPSFFHAMLENGVYPPPSPFESWFVNAVMTDDDFAVIETALDAAAARAAAATPPGQRD